MTYSTQMEAAKNNIVTKEMKEVSVRENIEIPFLIKQMAEGKIIIPANKNHKSISAQAVGTGLKTKVNVNLGISKDCPDWELEMKKAELAFSLGVESIMDLSCHGKTREFRKKLIEKSPAMIGTVPIYDAVGFHDRGLASLTVNNFFEVVKTHCEDGVDFLTIHAGINKKTVERLKANKRITNIVSRGGSLLFAWMELTGNENPFYEHFDRLLDICREYDVTLSLGDSCRPGCIEDATDASQIEELITLGELTKRAWAKDVQVMIEGPGHMALNEIEANMIIEKRLCHGAPFYVLGPLVTDIAPGYDHITSAIGGAIAASKGADFLCYVTPAEHLRLPDLKDVKEGIISCQIAAHAADIAKGVKGAREKDLAMSKARAELNWEKMFSLALDNEKPTEYRNSSIPEKEDSCTMCGDMCAIRNVSRALEGKPLLEVKESIKA